MSTRDVEMIDKLFGIHICQPRYVTETPPDLPDAILDACRKEEAERQRLREEEK